MRRTADCIHIHPIKILSISRGPTRTPILFSNRYVVARLHCGGVILRATIIPWLLWIQSSLTDSWNAWKPSKLDAGDGEAVWRVLWEKTWRGWLWKAHLSLEGYGAIFSWTRHKGAAKQEVFPSDHPTRDHPFVRYAAEKYETEWDRSR